MDWPIRDYKNHYEQNVEVKIKNRSQIYNVCRLKKFTNPENSKFKNEESIRKHTVDNSDANDTEKPQSDVKNGKHTANELIKNTIERRVTSSIYVVF